MCHWNLIDELFDLTLASIKFEDLEFWDIRDPPESSNAKFLVPTWFDGLVD